MWYFDHTAIYHCLHLCLVKAIDLHLVVGISRNEHEVNPNASRASIQLLQLNAKSIFILNYKVKQNPNALGLSLTKLGVSGIFG
jgi:hypothetical protein